jgi:hypothetical protein
MQFMRGTAGYSEWDRRTNGDVLDKLKIETVVDYIQNYGGNGKNT